MKQHGLLIFSVILLVGYFLYEPVMEHFFTDDSLRVAEFSTAVAPSSELLNLTTAGLELSLSPQGGRIVSARLKEFQEDTGEAVELISGLLATRSGMHIEFPGLTTQPDEQHYKQQQDTTAILFTGALTNGLQIEKSYRTTDRYGINFTIRLTNAGPAALDFPEGYRLVPFYGILPTDPESTDHLRAAWLITDQSKAEIEKTKKIDEPLTAANNVAWAALKNRYFTQIAAPLNGQETASFHALGQGQAYAVLSAPSFTLAPGQVLERSYLLYMGPLIEKHLRTYGRNFETILNHGTFDLLSRGVLFALRWIHQFVANYGLCLILLTVALRILLLPLAHYNLKSLRDMPRIMDRIHAIEDDENLLPEEAAAKIQPLRRQHIRAMVGSFLPLAIQVPIFLALYQALDTSLELRMAEFVFWIQDLSAKDPFFILPLLMGLAMIFQQRLTTVSPESNRTWIWMPVGFALLFSFFPAGLVLFWLTDTLCSVGQLAWITFRPERA